MTTACSADFQSPYRPRHACVIPLLRRSHKFAIIYGMLFHMAGRCSEEPHDDLIALALQIACIGFFPTAMWPCDHLPPTFFSISFGCVVLAIYKGKN